MKFASLLCLMASIATALPTSDRVAFSDMVERQYGLDVNDLENGPCRPVTFIFARGTFEVGNMGSIVGPQTCQALKDRLGAGNVACQGVGGPYAANVESNLLPKGTSQESINEGIRLLKLANSKCPSTRILASGYSQGSALMSVAISGLASNIQNQVKGAVLFGYTKNKQNGGRIPNFPTDRTLVICKSDDQVCKGNLIIVASHLKYGDDAGRAADFLASKT